MIEFTATSHGQYGLIQKLKREIQRLNLVWYKDGDFERDMAGGEIHLYTQGRLIIIDIVVGRWYWTDSEFQDDGPDNPLCGSYSTSLPISKVFADIKNEVNEYLIESAER